MQGSPGCGDDTRQDGTGDNGEKIKEIPKEEDLVKISLYDGSKYFTLKNPVLMILQ